MPKPLVAHPVPGRPWRRPFRVVIALWLLLTIIIGSAQPASAGVSGSALRTDQVDGIVYAMAHVNGRTIIGGDFTAVGGLPRRNAAAILPDGTVDPHFNPGPNGIVRGIAVSQDGTRVFLGGQFDTIASAPRANLAALDAVTGTVIEDWKADTNGIVYAVVVSGERVYAGGNFTTIGDATRRRLAALDSQTATVFLGFNPWPEWTVKGIAVSPDGTKVYAVGGFKAIGGTKRNGAAELRSDTGAATTFDPSDGGVAIAVALSPDGSRMFFSTTDNWLRAYDPALSSSPVYSVKTSGDTQAIAVSDTEVYIGGHFGQLTTYRVKRSLVASIRLADGTPTDWAPHVSGNMGIWAIALTGDSVILGGDFSRINGQRQQGIAFFTGTP